MTPDDTELFSAKHVVLVAQIHADYNCRDKSDAQSATAAILCRALELATPGWSAEARARLFLEEQ